MADRPLVIVTRKLPDVVETRLRELFDARLNLEDKPFTREELIDAARVAADPVVPAGWPDHLRADGTATARRLVAGMGVPFPFDPPAAGRL